MAIIATNEGGSGFEPIEAGTYAARCYSMIHIGTITEAYMGQPKEQNKIRLTWELPTELKEFKEGEGEKPYMVSKDYALSMYDKSNLRKHIDSWRGKPLTEDEAKAFDVTKLLGAECMLSIIHKPSKDGKKVYAEITSVSRLMKGTTCPPQINETFEFSWSEFDQAKFDSLPEWLRKKMTESVEYKQRFALESQNHEHNIMANEPDDSGLPF